MSQLSSPNSQSKKFSVDARTVLQLGRESIKDAVTAVVELVKNSYDADASAVDIDVTASLTPGGMIRVSDNGTGMTETDVDDKWLRIGYSEKRSRSISGRKRRRTGEKGVGRISADRLGSSLMLRSIAANAKPVRLNIDWDQFNVDGRDIGGVTLAFADDDPPTLPIVGGKPSHTGTELVIRSLRQTWTTTDLEALYFELSILTPPFGEANDFDLRLKTDIRPELNGSVVSPFVENAEVSLEAQLSDGNVKFTIRDRIAGAQTKETSRTDSVPAATLAQRSRLVGTTPLSETLGSVQIRLFFYPRKASTVSATELSLSDLREFLDKNAGVKIYRDGIRVRPYGDAQSPEGDWLGLAERKSRDPAGVSRSDYRVGANQLVGAVFVSRDANPALQDSSAREGLIHNDAYADLRALVLGCVGLLESHRHEVHTREQGTTAPRDVRAKVTTARDELDALKRSLMTVRRIVPDTASRSVDKALDQVSALRSKMSEAREAVEEILSESGVLRGLATLGIAASVFGHETQSSISGFLASTSLARQLLSDSPLPLSEIIEEVDKAARFARQVDAWGAFALKRVKRDKRRRRKINVEIALQSVAADLKGALEAASISLEVSTKPLRSRMFEMDFEALVLNLLTNAYFAVQQSSRARQIRIALSRKDRGDSKGFELIVGDSGPGVPPALREKIWRALFTTKVDSRGREAGTGLGLTIVKSVVEDFRGIAHVDSDPDLLGARFSIWLPVT